MNTNLAAFERFAVIFQAGDLIFSEFEPGDSFYLIQSGRVQISKVMGDIEKTIDILYPGEVFGEMAILEEAPRSANAVALDQVKALEFNRANFEILMRGNPQIALKLLKLFTKRIFDQRRRFMVLTLNDIQARVLDVFLMLSETDSNQDQDSESREFKTTMDDVAHWAGLPTDKCREVINHFASQGRIEVYPDRMVVKNINEFVRFVNSRRRAAE
ncbi:MAG: Crp/Fnr family transcriptional regulator [Spirochaetales bacterium]|jgi:CRP-like cAMP-binding protein|nr:Crp/Fnr family transcriptional regulator [Spirochaetales bacterium]